MNPSRWWRDPFWVAAGALYLVNRFWARKALGGMWLECWGDDFLLLPVALPPLLALHGWLGWRPPAEPPRWSEIGLHWLVWSVVCEALAPQIWSASIGDWCDVLAYGFGAVLAGWWWNRPRPVAVVPA